MRMSLFTGKHGGKMIVVIGQNVELVNLGKGYMGIPCSVLFLQLSNNFEIISKLKVTPKCQQCFFFFLIVYLFIRLHQVLVAALQIFNLHLQHAGSFFFPCRIFSHSMQILSCSI